MNDNTCRKLMAGICLAVFTAGFIVVPLLHHHIDGQCHDAPPLEQQHGCAPASGTVGCNPFHAATSDTDSRNDTFPPDHNPENCSICILSLYSTQTAIPCHAPLLHCSLYSVVPNGSLQYHQLLTWRLHGCRAPPLHPYLFV